MASQRKAFGILFLVVATELIGFGLIIPILPQLASKFNVPSIWLGVLLASYSLAQFIAAPILGALSDVYGRKPVLIASKLGSCVAYGILAVSQSYTLFLIARLLDGFTGGNISTARAYVADITTPENRAKGMAVIGISFGTGFILGPALGGFLYGTFSGHFIPAMVAGSLSLAALILTWLFLEEPPKRTSIATNRKWINFTEVLKSPVIQIICVLQLVYMTVFSGFETTFSVFTDFVYRYTEQQNSMLFMYAGLLALVVQGMIMRKTSKRAKVMVILGFVITAIGFLLLAVSNWLWGLLMALAIFSVGIGLVNAYLPALLSTSCNDHDKGKVMGIYESLGSMGRILGPTMAYMGLVASMVHLYLAYVVVLLLLALGVFFVNPHETASKNPS